MLEYITEHSIELFLSLGWIGFLVMIVVFLWTKRKSDPIQLKLLEKGLEKISENNFHLAEITTDDKKKDIISKCLKLLYEFAISLSGSLSGMRFSVNQLIVITQQVATFSDKFIDLSQDQAARTEEVSSAITESVNSIKIINDSVNKQNKMLIDVISIVQELSHQLEQIQETVSQLQEESSKLKIKTKESSDSANSASAIMENISLASSEINKIAGDIYDINDKTNLLSLNAAIEAARAGDKGRGFSVVASEISKLSDQTTNSVNEIGKFVKSTESDISSGVVQVRQSAETITEILEWEDRLEKSLDRIFNVINEVALKCNEIDHRMKESEVFSSEILNSTESQKHSMSEINSTSESIAQESESFTMSGMELSALSEELNRIAILIKNNLENYKL